MLKKLRNSILVLCLVFLTGCVDQSGNQSGELTIAASSVAVAEILDALEVDASQVVGIPSSETYAIPERYKDATKLGSAMTPDMEILTKLNPQLIISPNSLESDLQPQYEKIGISSAFVNLKSVSGMYKSIDDLGKRLNKEEKAEELINEYVSYMNTYQNTYQHSSSPTVLILMGLPGSYVVATESSYVGDLVKLAGATNVYGDGDGTDFLTANPEDMLKKNPDIILRTSHALPDQVQEMFEEEFKTNDIWSQFDAVKNNKVYDLDHENFGMSATFRYQEALKELGELLYE